MNVKQPLHMPKSAYVSFLAGTMSILIFFSAAFSFGDWDMALSCHIVALALIGAAQSAFAFLSCARLADTKAKLTQTASAFKAIDAKLAIAEKTLGQLHGGSERYENGIQASALDRVQ